MSARDHIRSFPPLCALLAAAGTAVLMPPAARAADPAVPAAQESRQPSVMPPGSLRDPIVPAGAPDPLSSPGNAGSTADEDMPPVGRGEMFSEGQIRYCLAQRVRIDAIRPLLNRYDHDEIRRFNEQVADLNSRCSSYRYSGSALQDARAWLESTRPRIEQAARDAHRAAAATAARSTGQGGGGTKGAPAPARKSAPTDDRKQEAAGTPAVAAQKAPARRKEAAAQPEVAARSKRQPELPAPPAPPEVPAPPASVRAQPEAGQSAPAAPEVAQPRAPAPQVAAAERDAGGSPSAQPADTSARTQPEPAPAAADAVSPKVEAPSPAPVSEAQPPAAALPPKPQEPSPAAPAAEKKPSAPSVPASASPAPEVAAQTAAASASAPAGSGQEGPLARLTKEVHAVGSMVLERPAGGGAGDATAQLEVRYAAGGYIRSIVIAHSSGSADLDQQALALARTLRLPNAPQELQGQEFAVRFPVVFRSAR
jgi:TonB family protein